MQKLNQDMYARLFKLLMERPVSAHELSEKVGMHIVNTQGLMRTLKKHGVVHVYSWRQDSMGRDTTPVYVLGDGIDTPRRKLTAAQRQRRYKEKKMIELGKRFCTGCQVDRDIKGGIQKKSGKIMRWMCLNCVEKRNISPYARKEINDARSKSETQSQKAA